jgi:hypothetical protein
MDLDEIRNKLLNKEICRLCLEDGSELVDIFPEDADTSPTPDYFLRKFNFIEVKVEIWLKITLKT